MSIIATQTLSKTVLDAAAAGRHAAQPAWHGPTRQCHEAAVRALALLALLALLLTLLGLSGCGPGTGGTGVGPVTGLAPTAIAYSSTITVNSSLPVGTSAPASVTATLPPPGTAGVVCTANCGASTVTLTLEPDRVDLRDGCFNFTSQAPLIVGASGETALAGSYQKFTPFGTQANATSIPANLSLRFANSQRDSTSVNLSVRDTADVLLFGPITLQRAADAPAISPTSTSPVSICP